MRILPVGKDKMALAYFKNVDIKEHKTDDMSVFRITSERINIISIPNVGTTIYTAYLISTKYDQDALNS